MKNYIETALNAVLIAEYTRLNIQTGDIYPDQQIRFETLINDIEMLFNELIEQNQEG